jgi:hypothetical protein
MVELSGGEALRQQLAQIGSPLKVTDLTPAYMPTLTGEELLLRPVWRVTLSDGNMITLK